MVLTAGFSAISVYEELEPQQLEFSICHFVQGRYPKITIEKLMEPPLKFM